VASEQAQEAGAVSAPDEDTLVDTSAASDDGNEDQSARLAGARNGE